MPSLDVAIESLRATAGAKKFDDAVKRIQTSAGRADRAVKKTDKTLGSLGGQVQSVAAGMISLAAAYKGVRYIQEAVQEYALFEAQLANVNTMLDAQTADFLPKYERQLSELAVTYGQSTDTLSKGLYDILSASVDASDAISVLRTATRASIGGLTSTAIAADALTTVINAYGFEASEAGKISDLLFTTVKGGKLTFGELASSIGTVASIAASAGLSLEQVSAAIATMTRAGINADMAMTSLRGILVTFLSPTKENIDVARKYGLELNSATLQSIGLTGALEKLTNATKEDVAAIFSNVRALSGVQAIRQNLTASVEDYTKALNSAGKAEEAYQKNANTTAQALARNRELWAEIKRDLGKGITPEVNLWLQGMSLLVKEWRAGWEAIRRDTDAGIAAVRAGLSPTPENIAFIKQLDDAQKAIDRIDAAASKAHTSLRNIEQIKFKPEDIQITETIAQERQPLSDAQKKAGLRVTELFAELQKERELIGLTNEERERAIKLQEFEAQAKIQLGDKSGQLVDMYKKELENLQRAYELQEFYDTVEQGIKGVLGAPVEALLDETRDIEDVLKARLRDLGTTLLNQMYEQVIMAPILGVLQNVLLGGAGAGAGAGGIFGAIFGTGLAAAKGYAFRSGVKLFGKGGILNQPTVFPMANGGVGVGGEAGDEALMPLGRDSQGRLGVRSTGEEKERPLQIINVLDSSQFEEYLNTGAGERAIVNIMRRNKGDEGLVS